jgi:glucose dehydrogenase
MFALDAKTGTIFWEFFLVPKVEGDTVRGPLGATPLEASTWKNAPGIPISGGGTWTSYTLDPKTGQLYVPGGNPAPDFVSGVRAGDNLYTDSVVVLDAWTGDYKRDFSRTGWLLAAPASFGAWRDQPCGGADEHPGEPARQAHQNRSARCTGAITHPDRPRQGRP